MKKLAVWLILATSLFSNAVIAEAKTYYDGPKWGCYYYSSSWKKVYVSHNYCSRNDEGANGIFNSKTKKTYYTGPRWGCFYYSGNWQKNYVDHAYCGN